MLIRVIFVAAAFVLPALAQNCTYSISPSSNSNVPPAGGSFGPVSVTAVGTNCRWTASSNVSWMHVTYGQSGNGNGSFGYGVDPSDGTPRQGTITAAGLAFT